MDIRIKRTLSSQYTKSILRLTMGSVLAQLITIIVSPMTTRLYTPEQLGIYTLIITIVSIFEPIICGKYDMAIVSAKDEKEAVELVFGSIIFTIVFVFIIMIGYKFYLLKHPEIIKEVGSFAYLISVILITNGSINILNAYNNRYKEYKTISSSYVERSLFQNIGIIIFGLLKFGSKGLLLSQFIGSFAAVKRQGKHLHRDKSIIKNIQLQRIKTTMIKFNKQPLFSMPAHFINSISYSILNFFIAGLFGIDIFGYYSMSYRILDLPLSLISSNVSKIFFQRASEEKANKGSYNRVLKQMTFFLVIISIPIVMILILVGPVMFKIVFGDGWYISGVFVRILAPMYGVRLIVATFTPALIVSNKQRLELLLQSLFIISSVCSFFACKFYSLNLNGFLILITITYSIIYLLFYIVIYRLSKKTVETILIKEE